MIKKLLSALILVSVSMLSLIPVAEAAQPIELQTVTLSVENMTCSMCPITVRKSLEKVPGVIDARADYEARTTTVTYDPSKSDIQALTEATTNAGYPSTLKSGAQ